MHFRIILFALLGVAACRCEGTGPSGSPVSHGEQVFRERCAVCHSAGSGNAQGPGLTGVVGRKAGSVPGFPYTEALRKSGITWDEATLGRFLASPASLVPGTAMVISVPDDHDRRDLVAYLSSLRSAPEARRPSAMESASPPTAPPSLKIGAAAFGNYRTDGPGVRRRITVADLPAPFATDSAHNAPGVVQRPEDAQLHVPPGFTVSLFASGLDHPRLIRTAPNGDVFVAESIVGRIFVLRGEQKQLFARGLDRPFGIAFYPPGPDPRWIYVAENNRVVRFPYHSGDLVAQGTPQIVIPKLSESTGGHWTRDVVFSNDGRQMFVSVGSESNVAEGMAKKSPAEAQTWQQSHPLGATWDSEDHRADVLVFDPEGKHGRIFATGIRNCVGEAINPTTGDLWCSTNERDGLGDNLVPDYLTHVRDGAWYGWPWFYLGDHEDPRRVGERPDLAGRATVPDVLVQAHSASLEMTFYQGNMFPAEYQGNAFAAFHGSWNRAKRTGYKVVRVILKDGVATGEYEDFLTGFVVNDDSVWGRPVGVTVANDGALLVSEDANGTIWRVSH